MTRGFSTSREGATRRLSTSRTKTNPRSTMPLSGTLSWKTSSSRCAKSERSLLPSRSGNGIDVGCYRSGIIGRWCYHPLFWCAPYGVDSIVRSWIQFLVIISRITFSRRYRGGNVGMLCQKYLRKGRKFYVGEHVGLPPPPRDK